MSLSPDPALLSRVEQRLNALRPAMEADGGGVELVAMTGDQLTLRLVGACTYCPSQPLTLARAILPALRELIPARMEIVVTSA